MFAKRLLQFNLLISILTAIAFIFAPGLILNLLGINSDNPFYVIPRYFGTTHIAFGTLLWLALHANDPRFLRFIVIAFSAGDLSGTAVLLFAQLRGAMNPMGWAFVFLSFLFAIGYGYCALQKDSS